MAAAEPDPLLRPLPWQEPSLPSRLFLQLPLVAPEPEADSLWVRLVAANLFFSSSAPGGTQVQVDEETLTLLLTGSLVLVERVGLNLTVPVVLQYGGWLDPVLNAVEGVFHPDSARRRAPVGRTEVRITTASGGTLVQSGPSIALGDATVGVQGLLVTADGARPAVALRGALKLPTGGTLVGSGTVDVGVGVLLAWELGRIAVHLAVDGGFPGGQLNPPGLVSRPYGSLQVGFAARVADTLSLHLQLSGHTSPLDVPDSASLSDATSYLVTGVGWDPSRSFGLHFALVENLFSSHRGADYSVMLGVRIGLGGR
jgi:hypothetical protein